MEKLKLVIEQYGRWVDCNDYIRRIEVHKETDFSICVENTKSLLETIGKEIYSQKTGEKLESASTVQGVLKSAFTALGYPGDAMLRQIAVALSTIGQQIGELRNAIGATAHGKTLDELRERNQSVDIITREFLIDSTESIACLLIRVFEMDSPRVAVAGAVIKYLDGEDFNRTWDDAYGEFEMGSYVYSASEILFNIDKQAYDSEYEAFKADPPTELMEDEQAI